MELDGRDKEILKILQADSRVSNAEIAQRVGMSASACWRRVRLFEEQGLIERYKAELSPRVAGLAFSALVQVRLTRHNPEHLHQFIDAITTRAEVLECYATTGQADYHLRLLCKDLDAYNVFLEEFLFRLPAVQSAETNVVLREIKRSHELPL
jgi:DNA-binding Lrp family transcriptional regulator